MPLFFQKVEGELYNIDDAMLSAMDKQEGHPYFYERDTVSVKLTHDSQDKDVSQDNITVECFVYYIKRFKQKTIELEHIACYHDSAEKRYMGPAKGELNCMEINMKEVIDPSK